MNELQIFSNPEFGKLRTILLDGEPWAVGKDVAAALGYKDTNKALSIHIDDEDKMSGRNTAPSIKDNLGREQFPIWINESGLYSLILSSKLPAAKRFKRWVVSEVLPELRKTGSYTMPEANQDVPKRVLVADDYLRAAHIIASCRNERMPYVLDLLKQSGIEVNFCLKASPDRDIDGEAARLINKAINECGMTLRGIGRLTGLQPTQISRIRTGESIPPLARAKIICDALNVAIADFEAETETE